MSADLDYDRPPNLHRMQQEIDELRREVQELSRSMWAAINAIREVLEKRNERF